MPRHSPSELSTWVRSSLGLVGLAVRPRRCPRPRARSRPRPRARSHRSAASSSPSLPALPPALSTRETAHFVNAGAADGPVRSVELDYAVMSWPA
jgi:hypothetical protein